MYILYEIYFPSFMCSLTNFVFVFFSADGGCRHIGATLYEIEGFEAKSVTDGDNLWLKRARQHDCPVPIKKLKIMKARYTSYM